MIGWAGLAIVLGTYVLIVTVGHGLAAAIRRLDATTVAVAPRLVCRACEIPIVKPYLDGCCHACHHAVLAEVDNAVDPWPALEARS